MRPDVTGRPPFQLVDGRDYALTLPTAEVGQFVLVRDANERRLNARGIPQLEVLERTKGRIRVEYGWVKRWVSVNPSSNAYGKLTGMAFVQGLQDLNDEDAAEDDMATLRTVGLSTVGSLPKGLLTVVAATVRDWQSEQQWPQTREQ